MTEMAQGRSGVFLTAEWRYLVMLNFEVDPAVLRPYVPRGTELDPWEGSTLVSLVAFWFEKTRVKGWAVPFHTDFEEVNLRLYVRRKGPEGWRRGVVFIKEIVPRRAIAAVARVFYNERYVSLPMRHRFAFPQEDRERDVGVEYAWRHRGQWESVRATASGLPQEMGAGSLEEFITEHYWGYSAQRDGSCMEYEVEHPRWRVWPVTSHALECDAAALYGRTLGESLGAPAHSAFVALGSPITVRRGRAIGEV